METFWLIVCGIVILICIIVGISTNSQHKEKESQFNAREDDLISVDIESNPHAIYFDASKFPANSEDSSGSKYSYKPRLVYSKRSGFVKKGDLVATLYIDRTSMFATPSTGTSVSQYVHKTYKITAPFDGIISDASAYPSYMMKILVCKMTPVTESESQAFQGNTPNKYGIDPDYYKAIVDASKKLSDLKQSFCLNADVLSAVSKAFSWPDNKTAEHIAHLIAIDAVRCFEGFGASLALDTKEGFGLLALIWQLNGAGDMPGYDNIDKAYSAAATLAGYIQCTKTFADESFKSGSLVLPSILGKVDSDIRDKYLVTLYRWASLVANADDKITEREKQWLADITSLRNEQEVEVISLEVDKEFYAATQVVVAEQKGSTSLLQRRLSIGFARAGRIMDQLEAAKVVGPANGAQYRDVYPKTKAELDAILSRIQLNLREDGAPAPIAQPVEPVRQRTQTIKPKGDPMKELDKMIGLGSVKEEIKTLHNFVKVQQMRQNSGMKTSSVSYHCVFTGNPGTGKTTVARIVAEIYKDLGILKKGHLVETDRSGLVAEYVGQTAVKTNKIIDSALDGVLFIDEAYSLSEGGQGDFGKEAIATLLKRMEDDRDRLVVILAGYSENMKGFIDTNPGLQSRFNRYINFPDYTAEDLYNIFLLSVKKNDYTLSDEASTKLKSVLNDAVAHKDVNFGNGRFVRNLFEKTIQRQANRISTEKNVTPEILAQIQAADINA